MSLRSEGKASTSLSGMQDEDLIGEIRARLEALELEVGAMREASDVKVDFRESALWFLVGAVMFLGGLFLALNPTIGFVNLEIGSTLQTFGGFLAVVGAGVTYQSSRLADQARQRYRRERAVQFKQKRLASRAQELIETAAAEQSDSRWPTKDGEDI